jgi:hypothetical protein
VLQHDALNGPRLDATGDSQQNEGAQHGALLAMTAGAFEAWRSKQVRVSGEPKAVKLNTAAQCGMT